MHSSFKYLALWAAAFLPIATAGVTGTNPAATLYELIPGKYVVKLKKGSQRRDLETHLDWVNEVHQRSIGKRDGTSDGITTTYSFANDEFHGYAGSFDEATAEEIRNSPEVDLVEQDEIWTLDTLNVASGYSEHLAKRALSQQEDATYGLGAISHQSGVSDTYIYDTEAGADTWAYVVDSGVQTSHSEFQGRAVRGYNAVPDAADVDIDGHGTHVAGTIAGKTFGVTKQANIISVKVLNGELSPWSVVMDGFAWAVNDILAKGRTDKAVINMSLGGDRKEIFNIAVQDAFNQGVLSVVSAGNDGRQAVLDSPASAPEAITVGAVDIELTEAYFSNHGSTLDCFGPGVNVMSAWIGDDSAARPASGTSMAAPHVAGIILTLQSVYNGGSAADVTKLFKSYLHGGLKSLSQGSPDAMAYNGSGA